MLRRLGLSWLTPLLLAGGSKCKAKTSANYVGHKKHKSSKKASGSASTDNKTAASSGAKQNNAKPPAGAPKNLKGKAGLCWPNGDSMKMSNVSVAECRAL